jgi:hypothetical protein
MEVFIMWRKVSQFILPQSFGEFLLVLGVVLLAIAGHFGVL